MGKYFETDKEAMKKKRAEIGQSKYWQPKEGKNQIRILPPYSDEGVWMYELALHYGFTDAEDRKRAYPCMRQWKQEKCPACDAIAELKKVDGGSKAADRLRARSKYYVNLIDRRVGEDKVFIYGFSGKMMNEILSYDDDEDYGDLTNPKKGFDIILEKTGSGLTTRYAIRIKPKSTPAGDFPDLFDLEAEVPNEITAREMADLLQKQYEELLEDFDPEEYGKKKKRKEEDDEEEEKPKKKKKVVADDDDEEEEAPKKKSKKVVDDDDEDEEPPKKKKPTKKAKKEEEDED